MTASRLLWPVALAMAIASQAATAQSGTGNVAVDLISESASIVAGKPFTIAMRMKMAPQWHTYWKNPGDSGVPTRVVWTLPDHFKASDLQFQAPARFVDGDLALYGYEGETTFLTTITPPASLPPGKFTIAARATWLECKDICVPGKANLSLTLPLGDGAPAKDSAVTSLFAAARASLPRADPGVTGRFTMSATSIDVTIRSKSKLSTPVEFFPDIAGLIETAIDPKVQGNGSGWRMTFQRVKDGESPVGPLTGVLVSGKGSSRRAFLVSLSPADVKAHSR